MRLVLASLAVGLAACSAVPPEPIVPLVAGEVAGGFTLGLPLARPNRSDGLEIWAGVGAGQGIDIAFSIRAPLALGNQLIYALRDGERFIPPGVAIRKSFDNGFGIGMGMASNGRFGEPWVPSQVTAGPFVTLGTSGDGLLAARATAHLVYEIQIANDEQVSRHGLAFYGVASAGGVIRGDSSLAVVGGRVIAGTWLRSPLDVGVAAGPFLQGYDAARRPLSER